LLDKLVAKHGNVNGGTTFWYYTAGARLYVSSVYNAGPSCYNTDE
jgi:hypothetical protein